MNIDNIVNRQFSDVLFIDFESRSKIDLVSVGAHKYGIDPSTKILLTAFAFNNEPVRINEYDNFDDDLVAALQNPNVLKVAHNAEFDMALLKYTTGIEINVSEWFDTAYQAAYYGHPRKLANLAKRLGLTDKLGKEGVLFFSLPRKISETNVENTSAFNEPTDNPEKLEEFKTYAMQDVGTMREAFNIMPMLPAIEIFTSQITMEMNFNGVPFDIRLSVKIYNLAKKYEKEASQKALEIYGIQNLKSTKQVQDALIANGVRLNSLNKKERGGTDHEILELRDLATGTAFAKIPTAIERYCPDGRIHGELVGYGAHTGRWSSKGVQLQNLSRILSEVSEDLVNVKSYEHLKQHIRLCFGNVPNMLFTYADLSQIEARIVAWLAWSEWRMQAFADDVDIYARSAEKMFNIPHVKKDDKERYYGKCAELGFGYGGGHAAILTIQPDFYREVGESKVRELVQVWRNANPEIKRLWYSLERAMRESMRSGNEQIMCGRIKLTFQYDGKCGKISLPSGRALYYRGLHFTQKSNGNTELAYLDYSRGGDAIHVRFWGGVILENVTQAIARDVLVDIMRRVKDVQPDSECIATVHDEIWYLHRENVDMLSIVLEEMKRPITWAPALVTKGDGFTSDRYRK